MEQKSVHIIGEIMALIFVVPFLSYLLCRYNFTILEQIVLYLIIIFTIIIDGWLLYQWMN